MWYIFQCFFRYRSNVKNLVLTVPNMCCYGNKQCLTSKKIPVGLWSFRLTNRVEWNVQKSGRIDKTDGSKVEIQNKECKYTPDCEGMWEICEKIPPVRKQRTKKKKNKPLRPVGKNGGNGRKYRWPYALCIESQYRWILQEDIHCC